MKLIRDPIHGYIELDGKITKIVSSPYFQRLRLIKQNAMAYLVYPGMNHTRFEHCLGVMNLSREFAKYALANNKTRLRDDIIQLSAIAGLLHDVGHVAFSHTFENGLILAKEVYGIDIDERKKKTHVDYGIRIIKEGLSNELDDLSSTFDTVSFLDDVLSEKPKSEEETFTSLLISNYVDADRSDYLLRDSYYAGVEYGMFDVERLKRFLVFLDGDKIAIHKKAMPIV
ncbi:HD domain-containing protein, partial [Acidianus sp. RZ1]